MVCIVTLCYHQYCNLLSLKVILGKSVARPAELDQVIAKEIFQCGVDNGFKPLLGGTMCTDDFYEGNL